MRTQTFAWLIFLQGTASPAAPLRGKSGSNDVQTRLPVWPVSKHASPLTEPRPCSLIPAQTEVKAAHVREGSQRFNGPAQWAKVTLTQAVSKQNQQEEEMLPSYWDAL